MIACVVHYDNIALAGMGEKVVAKPLFKSLRVHGTCVTVIPKYFSVAKTRHNIYAGKPLSGDNAMDNLASQRTGMCPKAKFRYAAFVNVDAP
jgi:hypothetical protein